MHFILHNVYIFVALVGISIFSLIVWFYLIAYLAISIRKSPKLNSFFALHPLSGTSGIKNSLEKRKVSIIVPARNEEKTLRKCLDSLIMQDYSNIEIICVNDSSIDNTAKIIQDYNITNPLKIVDAVNLQTKPYGWSGKNWACYRGYLRSTGDILLFIDADTVLSSSSTISMAVSHLIEQKLDALTARPKLLCQDSWARITLPLLLTFLHIKYSVLRINNPENKKSGYLFGCFYIVTRKAYKAIGTQAAVRGEIIEDAAIGKKIKKENFILKAVCGEHNIESVFRGNWNVLQRMVIPRYYNNTTNTYFVMCTIFFLTICPFLLLSISFWTLSVSKGENLLVEVLLAVNTITITILISASLIQLRFGLFENVAYALASPIGGAIITFGFIFYIIQAKRKNRDVIWRGRKYAYFPPRQATGP